MPRENETLTEADVVHIIREHIEKTFPRTCPKCKRIFPNYRDYVLNTHPIGFPQSYDIELGEWKTSETTGNLSLSNCQCGNTLALSSEGMPLAQIWQVLEWVTAETKRRGVKTENVLYYLRDAVRKQVSECG